MNIAAQTLLVQLILSGTTNKDELLKKVPKSNTRDFVDSPRG